MSRRVQNSLVIIAALVAAVLVVQTQTNWLDGAAPRKAGCEDATAPSEACDKPAAKTGNTP